MTQFASTLYPQTNPTNPILLEFRETRQLRGVDPNVALNLYLSYVDRGMWSWSDDHRDHARRVLTRLATLSG
ncbi:MULTISPECIES: hypothetical protein [unclassified Microbacterium]|uniref:hypothetical protein n=1 Tax=unclassified Microbacterium TaxID=2609290 RepID=UPI000EA97B13|nr:MULTISPECIES: hypothetical protein [unclassified Microbacterium]MBT2485778.1 hypothetical protein [Microbacterium sp. ISL-108]RKN68541.1 hypothetical protein D7252_13755 [Microbacterium sp. CGR2]